MSLSFKQLNGDNIVKDDKGRVVVRERGSKVAIARFPDMDRKTKEYVANVYADLTREDAQKAMKFLNYESDENEFCS